MASAMIRLLRLSAAILISLTSVFGTEQLPQRVIDNDSRLTSSKPGLLLRNLRRKLVVQVFNFENRGVKDAVVWEGTKVTITCKVYGFSKGTRLFWTEPSGETTLPSQYGLKIEKIFKRVTLSNSGRYICKASDTEGGRYVSTSLFLTVEATPTIRTNNVTVAEGKRAVLRCTGTDQTKPYSISWLYEGKGLRSDSNIQVSGYRYGKRTRLTIHPVSRRHFGTYECRVTIGRVKISAYPQLTVSYPPEILEGPINVIAAVGATVTFHCNVTGFPEPDVTWKLNGMPVNASNAATAQEKYSQSTEKEVHVLTITDVHVQQGTDSGLYSCCIHNNHDMNNYGTGTLSCQGAYLHIQGTPSPPNVEVEPSSASSLNSSNKFHRQNLNSSYLMSVVKTPENMPLKNSRNSENTTTEEFLMTTKVSDTAPQPFLPFLTEAASSKPNMEEKKGAGSEGEDTVTTIVVTVAIPVAIILVIAAIVVLRLHYKRSKVITPPNRSDSHVEFSIVDECASVQAADKLSETLTGSTDSGARDCYSALDEATVYSFCNSLLEVKVGPEGGEFQSGSLSLTVPPGAVSSETLIQAQFVFDAEPMPTEDNWFVLSPILALQPHGLSFEEPVSIRFPFTASSEGWILKLMRESSDNEWKSVLTIDTDTQLVTGRDPHCNYNLNTSCLQLSHFCKYRWCGCKKENSSGTEKIIACSLFARMDSSGNTCNFFLYLCDNCEEIAEGIKERESSKGRGGFKIKGSQQISIGKAGHLNIAFTGNGFEMQEKSEMIVDLRKLWKPKAFGILERLLIPAKCIDTERSDGLHSLELRVAITTSAQSKYIKATFEESESPELPLESGLSEELPLDSGVSENSATTGSDVSSSVSSPPRPSDDPATDDVIHRASLLACEGLQWVDFGKELLQCSHSEVHDLFPGPIEGLKNGEKVEVIINKWKDTCNGTATIGNLRAAFCRLVKKSSFDRAIRKDETNLVSDEDIQTACTLACEGQDWAKLGQILLNLAEGKIREMFRDSKEGPLKNFDRVRVIIDKYREIHDGIVTIAQLRAAFCKIKKDGAFDDIVEGIFRS